MRNIIAAICFVSILTSCNGQEKNTVKSIPPKEFAQKLESAKNAQLIDVRTAEEYASQHLDNSKNIDWNSGNFEQQVASLDKSKPVFVYCMVGGRSKKAADKLGELGFTEVYDMSGGIMKWNAKGLAKPATGGMSVEEYQSITKGDKVLVSFFAEWCGPCKKMAPYMSKLESEVDGLKLARIDADKNKTIVKHMKVDELPTLILYEKGELKWWQFGYISENDLKNKLK